MSGAFVDHPAAAAAFLRNGERAQWHDQALWHIRSKRDEASQSIPEWEALREKASQIKRHALSNLAEYLRAFERNAATLGATIHWAPEAADHNRIVHGILSGHGVTRVVKSKSMLTEECGLNEYLAHRGIDIIDTDLGERIVQLWPEPPSHFVLPAIHRRREEIGELFHRTLGTEKGASDPAYLCEAARIHLREKLLKAQAGITGINFAVAETGGFVVCTNEGNADLGTALPPLHIACMGIEKIIPRARDLGVFLRILARSGTGQPITAYSSHFHGPRQGGELHIVIVDNGRSRAASMTDFRNALTCIRCAACLNTCPVYRRSGGQSYGFITQGPIGSVLTPLRDAKKFKTLPFASSLCGSCTDVCPVKIDLHHMLLRGRAYLASQGQVSALKQISMKIAGKILLKRSWYEATGRWSRRLMRLAPRWALYHRLNLWGRRRELPAPAKASFREWYKKNKEGKHGR